MGEKQYLDLLNRILNEGELRETRNSTTLSVFGGHLKFDIREKFPLLTTKKVFWKGIVEELLWFLRGKMDSKILEEKGVNIWKGNTSREYLDSIGLNHYREGDTGATYGHQWRYFNAVYHGCDNDYTGQGIDQIRECIYQIKNDPMSRRIFLSGWNPTQSKYMSLVPCHISYQFYVSGENNEYLSCHMYQRSADTFLGLPFNIASVSLLTYIMAHLTDKKPKEIFISLGDIHIYKDHIESVKEQLLREPYEFPTLKIIGDKHDDPADYKPEQFILENYKCHSMIKAKMIA